MEKQLKGNVISHIKSSSGSPIITPPQEANSWQQTDVSPKLKDILNQESRSNKLYSQPVGESLIASSAGNSTTNDYVDTTLTEMVQQQPGTISPFFEKFPLELRNEIYKYLLIDPILGTSQSVGFYKSFENARCPWSPSQTVQRPQYDISPQILRVCHAMYKEGSEILYGLNTFYLACCTYNLEDMYVGSRHFDSVMEMSPLTRYHKRSVPNSLYLYQLAAIAKVRQWKVVFSSFDKTRPDTDYGGLRIWGIGSFCQAISRAQQITLEIILAPIGLENPFYPSQISQDTYTDIESLLAPLRMVRAAKSVKFRDAMCADVPGVYPYNEKWGHGHRSIMPCPNLEESLKSLMMSNSPAERLGDMYERLVNYAEAFEMVEKFKVDMRYGTDSFIHQALERQGEDAYNRFDCPINSNVKTTQFGYNSIHPVEEALQCAKKAWIEQYDAAIFKRERAKIVKFLETQYRRINLAAMDVAEFVKSEKRMERFLSAPPIYSWKSFNHRIMRTSAEAVLLLEPYARALEREPSLNGRINQRFFAHQNSPFYSTLPRNVFIKQANDSFDAKQYRQCADAFKKAVDDMDTQYLQIRSARRVLFEADITPDTSCNIDLELSRVDEMVDWSVQEPEMCPGRQRMRRTIQSS
ncbi:hypothetical protein EYC80_002143 [Monilinia laxa]|uniref:Uncharacterized protein n=1 Tax=Monilinia laxa TaxID=61186 RepID=A0A5N6K2Y4_MONLA|nr:hypothetical protein EYC80_002143 [Monilinia laxa]